MSFFYGINPHIKKDGKIPSIVRGYLFFIYYNQSEGLHPQQHPSPLLPLPPPPK